MGHRSSQKHAQRFRRSLQEKAGARAGAAGVGGQSPASPPLLRGLPPDPWRVDPQLPETGVGWCSSPKECHRRAFQLLSLVFLRSKTPNSLAKNFAERTIPTKVQDVVPTLSLKCLST